MLPFRVETMVVQASLRWKKKEKIHHATCINFIPNQLYMLVRNFTDVNIRTRSTLAAFPQHSYIHLVQIRVHKMKRVSNDCLLISKVIPLYRCFDNNMSQCSTEHTQVYLVLQKGCLWTGIAQLDTLLFFILKDMARNFFFRTII